MTRGRLTSNPTAETLQATAQPSWGDSEPLYKHMFLCPLHPINLEDVECNSASVWLIDQSRYLAAIWFDKICQNLSTVNLISRRSSESFRLPFIRQMPNGKRENVTSSSGRSTRVGRAAIVAVERWHRRDCMCGYVHTWHSESLRAIDMLVKEWKG